MRTPHLRTTSRSFVLTAALMAGFTACGSDDDPAASPDAVESGAPEDATEVADPVGGADEVASSGGSATTLTMADGTAYEFVMSICETSNTDDFVLPDSYELLGATADGAFRFSLTRAGLDEDFISQVGTLEGDFDDSGQNELMLYTADLDDEPLPVDGAVVSGTFLMNAIGPTRPHGDQVEATLEARC